MANVQLFCLPYSGASAMVYSRWRCAVPAWLSVLPVELPGRGGRMGESLQTDMAALARQLAGEILPKISGPYALFGHGLGALLAFEMAHALRDAGAPAPLALITSGAAAPTRREGYEREFAAPKSDEQLEQDLRDLQGTPSEILENRELMKLTLPILRTDVLLCGRYRYRLREPLECPIRVLGGTSDKPTQAQLIDWRLEGASGFSLDMLPGGHFFIHQYEAKVLRILKTCLERDVRRLSWSVLGQASA